MIHRIIDLSNCTITCRKTQFLAGSNIYIAEDFSKKVRDKRAELRKFMKQTKKRQPLAKMSLRYDKLIMGKDVFTYNEVTGMVELTGPGVGSEDGGRVSPTSQPTTPHHARAKTRSKSSGRRKKLEKAFSTGMKISLPLSVATGQCKYWRAN